MKVKVNESTEFKPIKLEITIETEEELCSLWHRVQIHSTAVPVKCLLKHDVMQDYELWDKLDDLVIKHNLKK